MKNSFEKIILGLCDDKGVKLKEVAEEADVKLQTLYKIFEQDRYPTFEIAIKLCNYFDCSIDYLLGLTDRIEKDCVYIESNFIKNYQKILKDKHITLYQIKKDLGIGLGRIYDWKAGKYPYMSTLITLANYFKVSVDYLIK